MFRQPRLLRHFVHQLSVEQPRPPLPHRAGTNVFYFVMQTVPCSGRAEKRRTDEKANRVGEAIEESVVSDGWRSETLIYDGLLLYDRQMSLEPSMRRPEANVLEKTGIHIELAKKPMYPKN